MFTITEVAKWKANAERILQEIRNDAAEQIVAGWDQSKTMSAIFAMKSHIENLRQYEAKHRSNPDAVR